MIWLLFLPKTPLTWKVAAEKLDDIFIMPEFWFFKSYDYFFEFNPLVSIIKNEEFFVIDVCNFFEIGVLKSILLLKLG